VPAGLHVTPLIGQAATVASVVGRISEGSLIHIAAHAEFQPEAPLRSHIRLSDGILPAARLVGNSASADLMVLSACEAGSGAALIGSEVLGLVSALTRAGVGAVVASVWSVDDASTSYLMRTFHGLVADGTEPVRALARAQAGLCPLGQETEGLVRTVLLGRVHDRGSQGTAQARRGGVRGIRTTVHLDASWSGPWRRLLFGLWLCSATTPPPERTPGATYHPGGRGHPPVPRVGCSIDGFMEEHPVEAVLPGPVGLRVSVPGRSRRGSRSWLRWCRADLAETETTGVVFGQSEQPGADPAALGSRHDAGR
jgi:CHAT domain